MPQAARPAVGGHQRPAAERGRSGQHRAGQRPLRDQRDHGQAGEEQDARAGEHPPGDRVGGGQRQVIARLVHRGVVQAAAVVARPAGQHAGHRLEEPAQRPAARQLVAQHRVAVLAVGGAAAPLAPQQQRVPQQPGHRPEVRRGLALLLAEQVPGHADQGSGHAAGQHPEHGPQRQVDREHVQRAAPVEQARMAAGGGGRLADLPGGELAVVDHRVGDHPDLVAGRVRPPAEVDVVAEQRQVGVEAAELVPDVAADQHARRADREHGPAAVVLALVDLARLDPGEPPPGPVGGDARFAHHAPVGQVLQLRAEDGRPAAAGPGEQLLEGVGGGLAVVVQQPDPLGAAHWAAHWAARSPRRAGRGVLQRAGDGGAVPGVGFHAEDRVLAEQLGQRRPAPVPAAGVHPDHALHRMGLLTHRVDESRQQPCGVVSDDHGSDDVTGVPRAPGARAPGARVL